MTTRALEKVRFAMGKPEDLHLLVNWLKKPYIQEFWKDGGIIVSDFKKFTSGEPSMIRDQDDFAKGREKNGITLTFDFILKKHL